ncbi:MAG TPA: cell wall hydrolase [Firmicutes bacterium]|jgi:N-acetylmuramoyl-L-alanine amidase|nr:cell wall hydrolase [Bacillota bacterium]
MHLKKRLVYGLILGFFMFSAAVAYGQVYYVQPGDSLYSIAARYGISSSVLQQSNGLGSNQIYPGQALSIATQGANSPTGFSYTVLSGDSLFLLAQRFGVSIDSIKSSNNLSSNYLWAGKQLIIPGAKVHPSSSNSSYQVQAGDSLFLIAQRYGVSVDMLRAANNLSANAAIYPNQTLTIPKVLTSSGSSSSGLQLSQSDLNLLACLVTAESDGEPFEGQVAVAATILNRLRDPLYPKTIAGIIYQVDNGRYQYSPVLDGRINGTASASAYRAVQLACSGWDPSNGANGFYNPAKTSNQWVVSQPVTITIGNHVFFNS